MTDSTIVPGVSTRVGGRKSRKDRGEPETVSRGEKEKKVEGEEILIRTEE